MHVNSYKFMYQTKYVKKEKQNYMCELLEYIAYDHTLLKIVGRGRGEKKGVEKTCSSIEPFFQKF